MVGLSQDLDVLYLLQAAEQLNCCLFVHPWDMQLDGRMSKYWFPWLIGKCMFTLLNFCLQTVTGLSKKSKQNQTLFPRISLDYFLVIG